MRKGSNIYWFLAQKVLLAMGVLFAAQVAFYLCNLRIFHIADWKEAGGIVLGNLVFAAATVGTMLIPYLTMMLIPLTRVRWRRWYRTIAEVLYVAAVLLILIPRGCNAAYYQFTYRLLSDEIFSYLGIGGQMGTLVPMFATDYWYGWAVPLTLTIAFLLLNFRIRLKVRLPYMKHLGNDILGFVIGTAVVTAMVMSVKSPSDAAKYCQPKNTAIVNNDAYNILRTLFTPELEEVRYMSDEDADWIHPVLYTPPPLPPGEEFPTPSRNIVIIIVESLGQEFLGCYNTQANADTRTPFLDSLAQYCTLYDGRANGKKSIEGITAINTGIPNLMSQPFTNSRYGKDDFIGLPTILRRHGYHCAFYHGSYNGVMDFDKVCEKIGFHEYLGKDEYDSWAKAQGRNPEKDYDGAWGIFDEEFLHYTIEHLATTATPFLAEIFTVTSHHPYPMPDAYKGRFAEGRHPILKCVEYTDNALRRFFEEAARQPWYDSTLFIITGDHSAQGLTREYNDYDGWYRIPMMVFDPQHPTGRRDPLIVDQIDLYPTIIDYLDIYEQFVSFGSSALEHPKWGISVHFGNGYYCMEANSKGDPREHDIAVIQGDHEEGSEQLLRGLKALIQQYNYRIINNKLTIDP
ncbi:MAG: sulfatase-like hydrolase/transferase [Bacteroidales bacterium]|nr:sulfatase-like hydrolase/transferase [Bacteroidales bacterium]